MKLCRAIRGATTAGANTAEDISEATSELMRTVITLNDLDVDDIVSIFFTTTQDLNATFPATSVREQGLEDVPLMCAHEMNVPGALDMTIRAMVHVNTKMQPSEINHVYLRGAAQLRPEWSRQPVSSAGMATSTD